MPTRLPARGLHRPLPSLTLFGLALIVLCAACAHAQENISVNITVDASRTQVERRRLVAVPQRGQSRPVGSAR